MIPACLQLALICRLEHLAVWQTEPDRQCCPCKQAAWNPLIIVLPRARGISLLCAETQAAASCSWQDSRGPPVKTAPLSSLSYTVLNQFSMSEGHPRGLC